MMMFWIQIYFICGVIFVLYNLTDDDKLTILYEDELSWISILVVMLMGVLMWPYYTFLRIKHMINGS